MACCADGNSLPERGALSVFPLVVIMLQSDPKGPVGSSSEGLLVLGVVVDADQVSEMLPAVQAGFTPIFLLFNELVCSYNPPPQTHTYMIMINCIN